MSWEFDEWGYAPYGLFDYGNYYGNYDPFGSLLEAPFGDLGAPDAIPDAQYASFLGDVGKTLHTEY